MRTTSELQISRKEITLGRDFPKSVSCGSLVLNTDIQISTVFFRWLSSGVCREQDVPFPGL